MVRSKTRNPLRRVPYTSATPESLPLCRHSPPEIANTPLEGVVLVLRAMGVDKVRALGVLGIRVSRDSRF